MNENFKKLFDKVTEVATSEEAVAIVTGIAITAATIVLWNAGRMLTAVVDAKIEEIKGN